MSPQLKAELIMVTDLINRVLVTLGRFVGPAVDRGVSWLRFFGSLTLAGFVSANTSGCAASPPGAQAEKDVAVQQDRESNSQDKVSSSDDNGSKLAGKYSQDNQYGMQRKLLIDEIRSQGVRDESVLRALEDVPRHLFVPMNFRDASYANGPLPIGQGQTISQPYIVAYMTEALKLKPTDKVLEIGTGSGYQSAILADLVSNVYSIELLPDLSKQAQKTFVEVGIDNVHLKVGDGYKGWPEEAPFDAIIVTAAPPEIPQALVWQLADRGRLIAPVGGKDFQQLVLITRDGDKFSKERLLPVRFVPMVPSKAERN